MATIMQDESAEALDNLDMSTTAEKDTLNQITSTIKHMEDKNKVLK